MAKKRITELATETTLKDGQYVAIDHTTDGTKKLNLGAELTGLKEELKEYEDIFTGDVDESVQNWLDEHPEATTTVNYEITTKVFNNVASMVSDITLAANDKVATLGYYAVNDGGKAQYYIREKTEDDVTSETADGTTTTGGIVLLANGLVAELICNEFNVKQFGAKTGSENASYAQQAFEAVSSSIYRLIQTQPDEFSEGLATVYIPIGAYFVHDIEIPCGTKIYGDGYQSKLFHSYSGTDDKGFCIWITGITTVPSTHISGLTFKGGWTASELSTYKGGLYISGRTEVHILNVWFGSAVGCYIDGSYGVYFTSCTFDINKTGLKVFNGALTQLSQCFFYGNTSYSLTGNNTRGVWLSNCSFGNNAGGVLFESCSEIRIDNVEFTDKSSTSTDGAGRNPNIPSIYAESSSDIIVNGCTFNRRTGYSIHFLNVTNVILSNLLLKTVTGYDAAALNGIAFDGTNDRITLSDIDVNICPHLAPYVFNDRLSRARIIRCVASGDMPTTEPTVDGGVFCFNATLDDVEMQDCKADGVTAYCAIGLTRYSTLKAVNCIIWGTYTSKLKTYNNGVIKWISNNVEKHIIQVGTNTSSKIRIYQSDNKVLVNGYVIGISISGWTTLAQIPSDLIAPADETNFSCALYNASVPVAFGRILNRNIDVYIPSEQSTISTQLYFSAAYSIND